MTTTHEAISNLRHAVPTTRAEAARFLSANPVSEAERPLVEALGDGDWEVRNAAAYALAQLKSPTAGTTKALCERAKTDDNANVRKSCCYALGWSGDASMIARSKLLEVLEQERDIGVRCAAAHALERGGYDAGFEFLMQALRFDDERTNFEAFTNLGMLGLMPDDWMRAPVYMQLLGTAEGRAKLAEVAGAIRGERRVERVSTGEFIERAAELGLPFVCVSLTWELDVHGNVRKFDFVLMAPVDAEGVSPNAAAGVHYVSDIRYSRGPLARVLGSDDDGAVWFGDGPRLPGDDAYLATFPRFTQQGGRQTSARERVAELFALLTRIKDAGLSYQLLGSGMKAIFAWIEGVHGDGQ
jgi:hypothetical protein